MIPCIGQTYGIFSKSITAAERSASRFRRLRERAIGNPQHVDTCIRYASMRQIHAAIEHLHRGDFECAITLAAAGEGMLPPTEEPYFRELAAKWRYEDIVNWLRHGEIKDIENGKKEQREAVTITELGTIAVIYRAIAKFDAVFGDEKTPQMISIRICAGRVCRTVDAARRS